METGITLATIVESYNCTFEMLLHDIYFFKYHSQKRLNTERIIISGLFTNSINNRASCENILSNRTIFVQLLTMSVLPISSLNHGLPAFIALWDREDKEKSANKSLLFKHKALYGFDKVMYRPLQSQL